MSRISKQWWQQWLITADEAATRVKHAIGPTSRPVPTAPPLSLCGLEPRILFSATPIDMAATDSSGDSGATVADAAVNESVELAESPTTIATIAEQTPIEIIFVDASVPDIEQLLDDLSAAGRDADVIVLDGDRDGVDQITETLDSRSDVASIHVVSHAEDGAVKLGNLWLGHANLDGYAGQIASWQNALTSDADILLYGCELAGDAEGQGLIDSLSALSGADVAASDDDTGHQDFQGDWDLEYTTGTIETTVAFSDHLQQDWRGKLATINVDTDADVVDGGDSVTSLREAILMVNAGSGGDTIILGPGMYTLAGGGAGEDSAATGDLDILQSVTITGGGAASTVIDGAGFDRIFDVLSGTLTISGVTIQNGDAVGGHGGGIQTAAGTTLSLVDVQLSGNAATGQGGGGLANFGSTTITGSTFHGGNDAFKGGAIWNTGASADLTITNSTFSGNTAADRGGAILSDTLLNVASSTIAFNSAPTGGGIHIGAGTANISNTIVGENTAGVGKDVKGTVVSGGGNLIGSTANNSGFGGSDLLDISTLLDPALIDNGGETLTHALQSASQAIDPGTVSAAPATDQRGTTRDALPDIGAYEFVPASNTPPTADAGGPYLINEGDSLVLNASGSFDPDADMLSYAWDIDGDGQYDDASGVSPTVSWAALGLMSLPIDDDGPRAIGLQVDDGRGGITTDVVILSVVNVAPTLSTTGTGSATAGAAYTLNLSASDPGNDTISSWTINWGDGTIDTIAGNPTSATHTYNNTGFTYNILASATDEDGTHLQNQLLVASSQNDRVLRFGTDASFLQAFATADGSDYPVDVIVGPDGKLYLSGWNSNNVLRYDATTGAFIDAFVPAGSGGLSSAAGLAFGPDGHLYVASRNSSEVLRFDGSSGVFLDSFVTAGSGGLNQPEGLTFGPDGNLYVSDYFNSAVYKYDGNTGAFISLFVASGSGGLNSAEDLEFGPDGNLYVASDDGHSVLRYNGTTGAFIDAFVPAGSNGLTNATGITFGPDGHLYVGSWGTHKVLRFDGTTGTYIDDYIAAGSGGLTRTDYLNFLPEHQVTVFDNIPPTAIDDNYSVDQDTTLSVGAGTGLLSNDSDADGDPLVAYVTAGPANGVLGITPMGLINETNLSNHLSSDQQPVFSPDGSKIAFKSDRTGFTEIYTMDADGSNVTQLTFDNGTTGSPSWSPDGNQLVYFTDRDGNSEIYKINADGTGATRLTTHAAADKQPHWSPDGTKILFRSSRDGNNEIYVMDADGSNPTRLTTDAGQDNNPAWSPDGSKIVFNTNRDGDFEIYTMNADGTDPTRITTSGGNNRAARFSPDGTRIAYQSNRDGDNEIFVIHRDGTGEIQITNNTVEDSDPNWSADGTRLIFDSLRSGNNEIYVANLLFDGSFAYRPDAGFSGADTFSYAAHDGGANSGIAGVSITVNAANNPPSVSATPGALSYTEATGRQLLDSGITVSDPDGTLNSATLQIVVNHTATEDLLHFVDQNGIAGSFNASTGILQLNGTASVADYQTALRSIEYENTSLNPNENTRFVSITVSDGLSNSGTSRSINIGAVGALAVDTTTDLADGDVSSISALTTNKGADGKVSLREAILAANNTAGLDVIEFEIEDPLVGGAHTIIVTAAGLPDITDSVVIDGTSDNDFATTPIIQLDGSAVGGSGLVLNTGSDGSSISGLVINRFGEHGIKIVASHNNTIKANFIGTDVVGTSSASGNLRDGVHLVGGASGNVIGGDSGNVISANGDDGIAIRDSGTTGNIVQGNWIGTDVTGTVDLRNGDLGIVIRFGAMGNTIGGTAAGQANTIAFNTTAGVTIYDDAAGTSKNVISGNSIHSNGALGIDLIAGNANRQTANISSVTTDGGTSLAVIGSYGDGTLGADTITIEYFSNIGDVQQGKTYLGSDTVVTDASGNAAINHVIAANVAVGTYITATVTDSGGNTSEFSIARQTTVALNNPPTLANPIANQATSEDSLFSFQFAADTFADADGDTLVYTATLDDLSPLPGWLSFDGPTRTFTGTPSNDDVGTITIRVQASDPSTASASDLFDLEVTNTNDAPTDITLDNSNVNENADGGIVGNLAVVDPDSGDSHTWSVDDARFEIVGTQLKLKAGQSLDNESEPSVNLTITATDLGGTGLAYNEVFVISVDDANDPAVGLPTITGITTENETLTADTSGISDEDGLGSFSYRWRRGGVDILGATGNTYTLGDDDVGQSISVRVTFTDDDGNAEGPLESAGTPPIANINDTPILDPSGDLSLDTIQQDLTAALNTGNSVLEILGSGGGNPISDPDGPLTGIAVNSLDDSNGQWQYSIDGGSSWQSIDPDGVGGVTIDDDNALLLEADGGHQNRIRFQANAGFAGSISELKFRAWDGNELPSVGNGNWIDVNAAGIGGGNAFSAGIEVASIHVNARPTITGIDDQAIMIDRATGSLSFKIGDSEDAGGLLTVTATSSNSTLVPPANILITGSGVNREVTVTPASAETGTTTITLTVTDTDGAKSESSFDVMVAPHTVTVSTGDDIVDAADLSSIAHLLADAGPDGLISLREAIIATNNTLNGAGPDEIVLPAGLYILGGNDIDIVDDVVINGAAANTTQIDGNGLSGIFDIKSTSTTTVTGVTILGGFDGNGVINVDNSATLNLIDATLRDNVGSALHVDGSVHLDRVTLTGNTAKDGAAIYLHNSSDATLTNVTISGNRATHDGAAIWSNSTVTITNSTIAYNEAGNEGGALYGNNFGHQFRLRNTILTENRLGDGSSENVSSGAAVNSLGFNIDSDGTAAISAAGDQSGTAMVPLDVGLAALSFNGFTMLTHALSADSIAIDNGTSGGAPAVDQRGMARPFDGDGDTIATIDIGAYESHNVNASGIPVINGTVEEDQTLWADVSAISDSDGLGTMSFQWFRGSMAIAGASSGSYTLGDADVGNQISVEVRYIDGNGTPEGPLSSLPTGPVANVNDLPGGSLSITGVVTAGQVITAASGLTDDDGMGLLSYQWQRDGVDIVGATSATYTLTKQDVGAVMSVIASYTDAYGTPEIVSSLPTAAVKELPFVPPPPPPRVDDENEEEEAEIPLPPPEEPPPEEPQEPEVEDSTPESPTDQTSKAAKVAGGKTLVAITPGSDPADEMWVAPSTDEDASTTEEDGEREKAKKEKRSQDSEEDDSRLGYQNIYQVSSFDTQWQSLDTFRGDLLGGNRFETLVVGAAVGVSVAVSVGHAVWALRAGYMASTLVTTMPIWRTIDPLPVLEYLEDNTKERGDTETLQSIIEQGQSSLDDSSNSQE